MLVPRNSGQTVRRSESFARVPRSLVNSASQSADARSFQPPLAPILYLPVQRGDKGCFDPKIKSPLTPPAIRSLFFLASPFHPYSLALHSCYFHHQRDLGSSSFESWVKKWAGDNGAGTKSSGRNGFFHGKKSAIGQRDSTVESKYMGPRRAVFRGGFNILPVKQRASRNNISIGGSSIDRSIGTVPMGAIKNDGRTNALRKWNFKHGCYAKCS